MAIIDYQFILCDSPSFEEIGPVRARSRNISTSLDESGSAKFVTKIDDPLSDMIDPISTCIKIRRDKQDIWSGPVWTLDESVPSGDLSVGVVGWFEILMKRLTKIKQVFPTTDPGYIVKTLFNQIEQDGPLWITLAEPYLIGQLITLGEVAKFTPVGQIIKQLSGIENGFDWKIDPLSRQLNLYPKYGSKRDATFSYGTGHSNLRSATRKWDGSTTINQIYVSSEIGTTAEPALVTPFETPETYIAMDTFDTHTGANSSLILKTAEVGGQWLQSSIGNTRPWLFQTSGGVANTPSVARSAVVSPQDASSWLAGAHVTAPQDAGQFTLFNGTLQSLTYKSNFIGADNWIGFLLQGGSTTSPDDDYIIVVVGFLTNPPDIRVLHADLSTQTYLTPTPSAVSLTGFQTNTFYTLRVGTDLAGNIAIWHYDPVNEIYPSPKILINDPSMATYWNRSYVYQRISSQSGTFFMDDYWFTEPRWGFQIPGDEVVNLNRYGLLEEYNTLTGVKAIEILQAYATVEVSVRDTPRIQFDLITMPTANNVPQPFKDYENGDEIGLIIKRGRFDTGSSPTSVRVFGMNVDIADNGTEVTNIITTPAG